MYLLCDKSNFGKYKIKIGRTALAEIHQCTCRECKNEFNKKDNETKISSEHNTYSYERVTKYSWETKRGPKSGTIDSNLKRNVKTN